MPSLPRWPTPAASRRPGRRSFRPAVEVLDARDVPSVAALSPGGSLPAQLGSPFTGVVATFQAADVSGPNLGSALPHLHAQIDWGDGHVTAGTINGPNANGTLTVTGTNTYQVAITYPVTVSVRDDRDGSQASTLSMVAVFPGAPVGSLFPFGSSGGVIAASGTLSATAVPVYATAGQLFTGLIGVVQDTTPNATGANIGAAIDWGDGTRIDVVPIQPTGTPGFFTIVDSHFYVLGGTGTLRIWVQDFSDGRTAVTAGPVTVADVGSAPQTPAPGAVSPPGSGGGSGGGGGSSSGNSNQNVRVPSNETLIYPGFVVRNGHRRHWRSLPLYRRWVGLARL